MWLDPDDQAFSLGAGASRDVAVNVVPGLPGTSVVFALQVTDERQQTTVGDIVAVSSRD